MSRCVKETKQISWFAILLLVFIFTTLSPTKSLASTLFRDWYGLSHVDISPLFLHFTPQVSESVSLIDKLSVFYSLEKSLDANDPKSLSEGFTLFSTFSNFFKLSGVKYWHRGGYYDFWLRLIQLKSLNLNFGTGLGLSIETVSISLGNSKFLEDFDEFSFPHENRIHLLNLLGRLVLSIEIPMGLTYTSFLRYAIGYNVIWTAFGPLADSWVPIDAPSFERLRTHWQHSVAFKFKF